MNRSLGVLGLGAAALGVVASQAGAQGPSEMLQAGQWQSTTSIADVTIPNLPPQMAGLVKSQFRKPQTVTYCIKPEDLKRPGAQAMGGKNAKDCEYEEWSYSGGKMHAVVVCKANGGTLRMVTDGTGSSTAYSARFNTTISGSQMGAMTMKGTVSGKRIGEC